jgi:NAD(P)-dependent dehydrogenase (short-subunit alcohol dehydrogenase family)
MIRWSVADISDQRGRTAIVTGGNSGLGLATVRALARAGAKVIMTARDRAKGEAAAAGMAGDVEVRTLDLADLASVRAFAASVDDVALLVNNAGIMMTPRSLTRDGFELQFGTNHLGHFALTGLLLPRLQASQRGRVVTVSSIEHKPGKIAFEDLRAERGYSPRRAYQQSKLANVLFGLELDRRLRAAGSRVVSVLAHPGYAATNLQSTGPTGLLKSMLALSNRFVAQSVEQGALPQLYAATAEDVRGGEFFGPDGLLELRGWPTRVRPAPAGRDEAVARRLWSVSEASTGVSYERAIAP